MSLETTLLVLAAIDRAAARGEPYVFTQDRMVCVACLEDMTSIGPKTWTCTSCRQVVDRRQR